MTDYLPSAAPSDIPRWPSGGCRTVALIDLDVREVRPLFASSSPSTLYNDDAEDGLGPYEGFHIEDASVGMVAFVTHKFSPHKGTSVLVDEGKTSNASILTLLAPVASAISWTHPDLDLSVQESVAGGYFTIPTTVSYQGKLGWRFGGYLLEQAASAKPLPSGGPVGLDTLGATFHAKGYYAAAEWLLRRALAAHEKEVGLVNPDTAIYLNNLAATLYAQESYADAEALLRRALEIDQAAYGTRHPTTAISMSALAEILGAQHKDTEADALRRRATEANENATGMVHISDFASLGPALADLIRDHSDAIVNEAIEISDVIGDVKTWLEGKDFFSFADDLVPPPPPVSTIGGGTVVFRWSDPEKTGESWGLIPHVDILVHPNELAATLSAELHDTTATVLLGNLAGIFVRQGRG